MPDTYEYQAAEVTDRTPLGAAVDVRLLLTPAPAAQVGAVK
jgi:hypothetical protein